MPYIQWNPKVAVNSHIQNHSVDTFLPLTFDDNVCLQRLKGEVGPEAGGHQILKNTTNY